jgi:hypothetical protein
MFYPVNQFPKEVVEKLARSVVFHTVCYPGQQISGDTGERLWAEALGINDYKKSHELADVKFADLVGWSVKVRNNVNPQTQEYVDLKLTTRFAREPLQGLTPTEIASVYFGEWSQIVMKEQAKRADLRTIILLFPKNGFREFALYEYQTHTWKAEDYDWRWSCPKETTLHGFCRSTGQRHFAIHLNDSRLFVHEKIGNRQVVLLDEYQPLCMDAILSTVGFTTESVTLLPMDSEKSVAEEVDPSEDSDESIFGKPFLVVASKRKERKPTRSATASLSFLDESAA